MVEQSKVGRLTTPPTGVLIVHKKLPRLGIAATSIVRGFLPQEKLPNNRPLII